MLVLDLPWSLFDDSYSVLFARFVRESVQKSPRHFFCIGGSRLNVGTLEPLCVLGKVYMVP